MPAPSVRLPSVLRRGLQVAAFNTLIALGLALLGPDSFLHALLYSQLIGLAIWAAIDLGQAWLIADWRTQWRRIVLIAPAGVALGFAFGMAAADALLGRPLLASWTAQPARAAGLMVLSLLAGAGATYAYTSQEQARQSRQREEALRRESAEARLRLLEAQLEPHMLFNTLANLRVLIEADAQRAQEMLDRLVAYLRATLGGSRALVHPLSDEFARLRDYLALMAVRMGPRLRTELQLPTELAAQPVPALLLQPLVENSLLHGLEPKLEGGTLRVSARREGGLLVLEVADTGLGLPAQPQALGFGLAQVRERLHSLHGDAAGLALTRDPGGGTRVRVHLPLSPPWTAAPSSPALPCAHTPAPPP